MKLVLCYLSALEYLRMHDEKTWSYPDESSINKVLAMSLSAETLHSSALDQLSRPLHVLVSRAQSKRSYPYIVNHQTSRRLPKGAILDLGIGVYFCSPELCFVQMATVLDFPQLVELGFELCGTYDKLRENYDCKPLTTVKKLDEFCKKVSPLHGVKKARRALKYVANCSASPMESKLAIMLCLPYKMGGYGFEVPHMNYPITFDAKARRISGTKFCKCDLYWSKKKLAVEYDGQEFHEDSEKMFRDASRRNALLAMGIDSITVTKWQIKNGGSFNVIAGNIAKKLNKQLRCKDPDFTRKFRTLQSSLMQEGNSEKNRQTSKHP